MDFRDVLPRLIILILCLVALRDDLQHGKIRNKHTLTMIVIGMVWHIMLGTYLQATWGLSIAFTVSLVFFALGFLAGGDGKLLMAIGTWLGFGSVLGVVTYSILLGGVYDLLRNPLSKQVDDAKRIANRLYVGLYNLNEPDMYLGKKKVKFAAFILIGLLIEYVLPINNILKL